MIAGYLWPLLETGGRESGTCMELRQRKESTSLLANSADVAVVSRVSGFKKMVDSGTCRSEQIDMLMPKKLMSDHENQDVRNLWIQTMMNNWIFSYVTMQGP